jgi:prolipoprotein diacylglyceryl transferase
VVGVPAASAGRVEMDLVGAALGVPVVEDGIEPGQAGARTEEQRQQQECPESSRTHRAKGSSIRRRREASGPSTRAGCRFQYVVARMLLRDDWTCRGYRDDAAATVEDGVMPTITPVIHTWLVWNVNPVLLHLGPLTIRWYGVLFALGLLVSYEVGRRILERDGVTRLEIDRLFGYVTVGTVVGARLGHTLLYEPGFYLAHPLQILYFWQGGLASHGGTVGIMLAVWWFARKTGRPTLWLLDRVALVAPLAAAFIRLGNLFNSEIVGKPSRLPWAVVFTRVDSLARHPTQIYEAVAYLMIFFCLARLYRRSEIAERPGRLFGTTLVMIFGFRFLVEFLKEPQVAAESGLPLDLGQLLSLPLIAAGLFLTFARSSPVKTLPQAR